MNERLKSIIDLKRYPIYDLNSPIIKNLIKRCKEELDQFSCSTIPNFILPESLKVMNSESPLIMLLIWSSIQIG